MWDTYKMSLVAYKQVTQKKVSSVFGKIQILVTSAFAALFAAVPALAVAGGTIGNYTSTVTPVDVTTAAPGILTAYGMLVDMLVYIANEFFLKSAMGQIYIAMAGLLFTFILVKSLLRHSSGGRRR